MKIRVGMPLWKVAARLGLTVQLRVRIHHDPEAGVYVAESPDLDGLVCEAKSLDELKQVTLANVAELMELALDSSSAKPPSATTHFTLDAAVPLAA